MIWCELGVQIYSFACKYPVVPASFVDETILSALNGPSILVKNQLTIWKRMKFDSEHTHKEVNSKWIKDLNVRPEMI